MTITADNNINRWIKFNFVPCMEIISGVVSQYLSLSLYIKKQFVHVYCDVDSKQVHPHLTILEISSSLSDHVLRMRNTTVIPWRPYTVLDKTMANRAPACNVHYVGGSQAIVTVNNGSRCGDRVNQTAAQPAIRHVTMTPLSPPNTGQPRITLPNSTPIALRKLLIKAVHKGEKEKKDSGEIFTLRNINPVSVSKVEDLKSLIKAQLAN